MNKKLLIGTIVVFGIAAAIFRPMLIGNALIVVWIYLVWMVWKKKTVSRYLKALKTFLLVAGISGMMLIIFLVGVVLYNAVYGLGETSEIADTIAHYIGFSLLGVFDVATIGGLVIFLIGRRKQAKGIPK